MKIGNNIIALRGHFGLSQRELANQLGVSKATISLWENEKKYPSRKNIEKLIVKFQLNPKDLFGSNVGEVLTPQAQFKFQPSVFTVKEGIELHIAAEKLSKEELDKMDKAVQLLKVFYS